MVCKHLAQLERELLAAGVSLTFRGQAWTSNCREWAYFACVLDRPAIRERLSLPDCVRDHDNDDSRSGLESGLVCTACWDAVVGIHATQATGYLTFK
jgi:hypothetical protein